MYIDKWHRFWICVFFVFNISSSLVLCERDCTVNYKMDAWYLWVDLSWSNNMFDSHPQIWTWLVLRLVACFSYFFTQIFYEVWSKQKILWCSLGMFKCRPRIHFKICFMGKSDEERYVMFHLIIKNKIKIDWDCLHWRYFHDNYAHFFPNSHYHNVVKKKKMPSHNNWFY